MVFVGLGSLVTQRVVRRTLTRSASVATTFTSPASAATTSFCTGSLTTNFSVFSLSNSVLTANRPANAARRHTTTPPAMTATVGFLFLVFTGAHSWLDSSHQATHRRAEVRGGIHPARVPQIGTSTVRVSVSSAILSGCTCSRRSTPGLCAGDRADALPAGPADLSQRGGMSPAGPRGRGAARTPRTPASTPGPALPE